MLIVFFTRLYWMLVLVTVQVLVFNHIHLLDYATPLPYVYLLVMMPKSVPRYQVLLWGFFTGLLVDMFSNTPGMAAASMTFTALLQPMLLGLMITKDETDDVAPSFALMGTGGYLRYVLILVFIHHLTFYFIEFITFYNWMYMAVSLLGSWGLSALLIVAFERLRSGK